MIDIHAQRIIIIDFGSQYTQLIARRVREVGVYCEIHPWTLTEEELKGISIAGIILSGGPESVTQGSAPSVPEFVFTLGCPVLGICYGMHSMAIQLGGEVKACNKREFGFAQVLVQQTSELLRGIKDHLTQEGVQLDVWMSHGDSVVSLPADFTVLASTDNCPIAAIANEKLNFYGLQFHPEVSHTLKGHHILERFVVNICGCKKNWILKNIIAEQISSIQTSVKDEGVILGLSGGVDSTVAALLLHKAIGDQLTCVFVDTGLLRLNESIQVKALFEKHYGIRLIIVDAKAQFYQALAGVSDPEEKRKIIGRTFIEVFNKEAQHIPNVKWLAQGTIYSDVIESAATKTGQAQVIKSHHNVGGLPEVMQLKLIEPLRELFKDEVRKLGTELGVPAEIIKRHPFPGPGLGIRVLGEIKSDYLEKLRRVDAILIEALHHFNLYDKVSQAFAVYLPVKSVGVIGDARQYEHVIALRVVETTDFMTASWSQLPYEFLSTVSNRIINEVAGISRVTYDISNKPPATIEWE